MCETPRQHLWGHSLRHGILAATLVQVTQRRLSRSRRSLCIAVYQRSPHGDGGGGRGELLDALLKMPAPYPSKVLT